MQIERVVEHNAIIIYHTLFKNNNLYCLCSKIMDSNNIVSVSNFSSSFKDIYYCSTCNFKVDWNNVKTLFKPYYYKINLLLSKCSKCKTCGVYSRLGKLYFMCDCDCMSLNFYDNYENYLKDTEYFEDGIYYNGKIIYSTIKKILI